jgi:hypothetical protein
MNQAVAGTTPRLKQSQDAIRLTASEARVHGTRLRFEPETYKNVLGYWTEVDDWAEWEFESKREGPVDVEIHCGCGAGNGGSNIDVILETPTGSAQRLAWTVRETGHFQNIVIENLGTMALANGRCKLMVRPQRKAASAIVDIRQVMLIPTP